MNDIACNGLVWFMVFNATFNNISVILWWSVSLVEETGVPGENHQSAASFTDSMENLIDIRFVPQKKIYN